MNITKIKILLIAAITAITLSSCSDFFDTKPTGAYEREDLYKDVKDVQEAVIGLYNILATGGLYGNSYGIEAGMAADDLSFYYNPSSIVTTSFWYNNYRNNEGPGLSVWGGCYKLINNANLLLAVVDNIPTDNTTDEILKNNLKGEAIFLRAYAHYILALHWGDVPYKTWTQENPYDILIEPTSQEEIMHNVVAEMTKAESLVRSYQNTPLGQISKSVVRGVLARVYMKLAGWPFNGEGTTGNSSTAMYKMALHWALKVNGDTEGGINIGGVHKLNPSYEDFFIRLASGEIEKVYNESIWEIQYAGNGLTGVPSESSLGTAIGITNNKLTMPTFGFCYGRIDTSIKLWDLYNDIDGDGEIEIIPAEIEIKDDKDFDALLTEDEIYKDLEINHPDVRRNWNITSISTSGVDKTEIAFRGMLGKKAKRVDNKPVYDEDGQLVYEDCVVLKTPRCRDIGKYRREYNPESAINKSRTSIKYPVLRYADVLLMIAESANEVYGYPTAVAYQAINMVRSRSIINNPENHTYEPISGMSYLQFKELVKDERARELCFEGQRKIDLIRWNSLESEMKEVLDYQSDDREAMTDVGFNAALNLEEKHKWLPIPPSEIILNTKLRQNPLWL